MRFMESAVVTFEYSIWKGIRIMIDNKIVEYALIPATFFLLICIGLRILKIKKQKHRKT